MNKYAYLIMAHDEFGVLQKMIQLLDDERNDIYVHFDTKAGKIDFSSYEKLVKKSCLEFVDRTAVTWGAYSQINAELVLLKSSLRKRYEFYHLLSGSDLPIKSQDEVHSFFDQHIGSELLDFDTRAYSTKNYFDRVQFYHFFQEKMGKNRKGFYGIANKISLKLQEIFRVNRMNKYIFDFNKGLNWFSITNKLAEYVLSQEMEIKKIYKYSLAADEVFLHTLVWNSKFKESVCGDITRITKKGRPYIFRNDDFDLLMKSKAFWARKFSENVDPDIVQKIYKQLLRK